MKLHVLSEALSALTSQGWSENRKVDVTEAVTRLRAVGYVLDDYAVEVLASLYGITISPINENGPNFINDDELVIDPLGAGVRHMSEANALRGRYGQDFCPLGWWICNSHVFFSSGGPVIASTLDVGWYLGDSIAEALNFVILANAPLVRAWSHDGMDTDK